MKTTNTLLFCLSAMIVFALVNPSGEEEVTQQPKRIENITSHTVVPETFVQQKLINNCRKFIGTPHQLGGTDKNGIDCSGLLYVNFDAVGLSIPRSSADQSTYFTPVPLAQAQTGDLVFFGSSKLSVNHAGIISNVDDEHNITFIHTSSSFGVVEESLSGDYWPSKIQKIGRPDYEMIEANKHS